MDDSPPLEEIAERLLSQPSASLTPAERGFVAIWELEADVNNGGFSQYFFNSAGGDVWIASRALRDIGADRCADIVDRAGALLSLNATEWASREARQSALEALSDSDSAALDDLDAVFYGYPDDIDALLRAFVLKHRDGFSR